MDIVQRNFLRLLRCGAFGQQEQIEPMSEWKWRQLLRLSQIHGVTPWVADGMQKMDGDFFLQLSQALRQQFYDDPTGRTEDNSGQRLSNPVLNGRLQKLRETAAEGDSTFRILEDIIAISHSILTQGISLRQLIILGSAIRKDAGRIRHDELREWIEQLGMTSMARLEGALLVELLGMKADELQFTDATKARNTKSAVSDLFRLTQQNAADWYFTQGESIFVRTNNSDAMLWRLRQSVKYMHYYPVEAIPSLAANFAHSLTHIEE